MQSDPSIATALFLLGAISWVATVIIILLVTARSIADVARGMGLLPERLYKFVYAGEEERTKKLLAELGILPRTRYYRSITSYLDTPLEDELGIDDIKSRLDHIVKRHTVVSRFTIGDVSRLKINYFVNLRQAYCTSDDSKELCLLMACFVKDAMRSHYIQFDAILSRKDSLDLLGYHVSQLLKVPFLLYNPEPAIWEERNSPTGSSNVARNFEYDIPEVRSAIIIDDSCVNGNSVVRMAKAARGKDIEVLHAFLFFIRGEADSMNKLKQNDINLHYLRRYSDSDLANFVTMKGMP